MGRKSKLTALQWAEVDKRRIEGESRRALAKAFGVSEASIREREQKIGQAPTVQKVAQMIVETDAALAALPISAQVSAQNLAARLKAISSSLAAAAEQGAATAHRLSALANSEVGKVDDANPLDSMEALKGVSALTRLANDSASIALNLLAANRETVRKLNDPDEGALPPGSGVLAVPGLMNDAAAWSAAVKKATPGG